MTSSITPQSEKASPSAKTFEEWLSSREGQKAVQELREKAEHAIKQLRDAQRIDLEFLREPVTV
jgi:hypothetical protein